MFIIVINYTIVGPMEIPLIHTSILLYYYIIFQHKIHLLQISIDHYNTYGYYY